MNENEYNLILQSDVNTKGYGQWFFFEVTNGRKNQTVKFNILNYVRKLIKKYTKTFKRKSSSLHNQGMRILVYSIKEAQKSNIGWNKTTQADYFCNYISRVKFSF